MIQPTHNAPKRPAVRYHGGKWRLAPWIISHFPEHRIYTEVFGGGASVLLRKPRAYAEIYNDLDGEIVNLFTCLRDHGEELRRRLHMTPFARADFVQSYQESDDPIEQARRTIVRSFMGFGSAAVSGEVTGFRATSNRSGTTPAHDWQNFPACVPALIERLRGVVIEQRPYGTVLLTHDSPGTLHYVDPPYVHSTRSSKKRGTDSRHSYRHELTDEDHEELAAVLNRLEGGVVLSGYDCDLYERLFQGWRKTSIPTHADGAQARTECLWLRNIKETAPELF